MSTWAGSLERISLFVFANFRRGILNLSIPGLVPGPADETEWMNLDMIREQTQEIQGQITGYLYSLEDRAKVHVL